MKKQIGIILVIVNTPSCFILMNAELHFQTSSECRGGGGVLPYMGYIGMYGAKGYGFSAVLVINRVSIFAV